ncbi:hypothetical protein F4805DRAFT_320240 [Annulohypoxylon moriforme]|nr:hypothetical protein F4805DRAFT_320240 [Annulohypoxylon moriforme]
MASLSYFWVSWYAPGAVTCAVALTLEKKNINTGIGPFRNLYNATIARPFPSHHRYIFPERQISQGFQCSLGSYTRESNHLNSKSPKIMPRRTLSQCN